MDAKNNLKTDQAGSHSPAAGSQHDMAESRSGLSDEAKKYLRFGAMILTSTLVMFGLTYLNTYEFSHVKWSETRFYMVFYMGAAMALIMLGFMLSMYKNKAINTAIVVGSVIVFGVGLTLVRSQTTVEDKSWMNAMIPHHSIAILTSERAQIDDARVCELAADIVKAQKREIAEMEWLINDIETNGTADTAAEAEARPIPDFEASTDRVCP